jgi:glycosyltransferase involved in cell wall biosynthesis
MLVAAYKAMDVLAYPSPGTDPSCRTVRESLAAGIPVVGCEVGFLPTLIGDGETGFLAPSDSASLAEALGRVLADPVLRQRMSRQAGLEALERFSNKTQAGHCLSFYERLGARR